MTRARKVDANHAEIRDGLRAVLGSKSVVDTSSIGGGYGDLMVAREGVTSWIEIKRPGPPSARKLTPAEEKFRRWCDAHKIGYLVVQSLDEALSGLLLRGKREKVV